MLRRADAGDDVLALRVDEVFAVEFVGAGRGIARERDAGRAILAHIAEHHRLHIDRGAPLGRDMVQPPVGHRRAGSSTSRTRRRSHPTAAAAGPAGTACRSRLATTSLNPATICRQSSAVELGVEHRADLELVVLDQLLEMVVLDAEHDLPVHLQKAAIAVIGETIVTALLRQTLHGLVVETEIEHGVHHAGHRGARSGTHRDQQRPLGIAKSGADRFLDAG